ncbi:MAG: hypothetical protein PHU44_05270 [Syntrophales bacterium]|nr:hypothetical protein [Syntrophales bacterium]MDD5641286.1 hypothetical protein [Syntrophales bacterium]
MDPVFLAMLAKLGLEMVIGVIGALKRAGEPTDEEIRALFIEEKPEDLLKTRKQGHGDFPVPHSQP